MNRPKSLNRLRRSAHFVPGASESLLHKSIGTNADALVLDLEDSVTPDRKDEANQRVAEWLSSVDFQGKERIVRINALNTPWTMADIEATMEHPPDAYMVPKVSTLEEIQSVSEAVSGWESRNDHESMSVALILVSTETPLGALNVGSFPQCERVTAMTWGAEDLAAALGAPANRGPDNDYLPPFEYCRTMTLLSAAAGGVQPVDAVYTDFNDLEGLKRECNLAASIGFTGKLTIHPAQIDIVNQAFSPSIAEINAAERLIEAFEAAQAEGRMAFSFEGKMVDAPHLNRAKKILSLALAK